MTIVQITGVDVDNPKDGGVGHYLDAEGTLRWVRLTFGEAKAILSELVDGEADWVGYEIPDPA